MHHASPRVTRSSINQLMDGGKFPISLIFHFSLAHFPAFNPVTVELPMRHTVFYCLWPIDLNIRSIEPATGRNFIRSNVEFNLIYSPLPSQLNTYRYVDSACGMLIALTRWMRGMLTEILFLIPFEFSCLMSVNLAHHKGMNLSTAFR